MHPLDYDNSVPVTRDIHWVGFYDEEAQLHCNPYLLTDGDEAVLFDPGSIPHFPIVMRKVIDLVSPGTISLIIASHQDPDLCGNLAVVEDVVDRRDLLIAAHSRSVRLIRHYGVRSNFYEVDENHFAYTLKSGRVLEFIFTPYLHAPGAIMTYDRKTQTLFSSDIFGAISRDWSLFAGKNYLEPMAIFHQIYMPTNKIMRPLMEQLEKLPLQRILPQHGSVLEDAQMTEAMAFLKQLPCGVDLEDIK